MGWALPIFIKRIDIILRLGGTMFKEKVFILINIAYPIEMADLHFEWSEELYIAIDATTRAQL